MNLVPTDLWGGQNHPLGQSVSSPDLDVGIGDIEELNHHFVGWATVIGIDDADAVGHQQPALEWCAASGDNRQEVTVRHFDDEASPDQCNLFRRNCDIMRCRQVEACRVFRGIGWEGKSGIQSSDF